ncbi:hypothetical protein DM01DRAFT_1408715 [Hesseltinella vesiculosa]|uniref:Uncharacterized protein n=1 Tax=Hesseltinella vesiculosa TaxID=101127 RepID=A0A1X2GEH0_9FUNG|nr:hypothetical protein DM01DRAFT_1408715 [Hesseltinella vesiculosa]
MSTAIYATHVSSSRSPAMMLPTCKVETDMPCVKRRKKQPARSVSNHYAPPTPPQEECHPLSAITNLPSTPLISSISTHAHPAQPSSSIGDIENEMAYTKDSLATLTVMYDSLRQAYDHGKPQLRYHPTRLDAMEKELLSAYDDLELQVIHLGKHIAKLEASWMAWKSSQPIPTLSQPPF